MKIITSVVSMLVIVGTFCHIFAEESHSIEAIQIISPLNHSLRVEVDQLKRLLEADDLKDRYCVVISIAGAFRKGKSFLLNFFIKYLNAQYKSHNVSDWIGENSTSGRLDGFKYRGGRKPETIGIWMWSEIFTHDFENGDKIAIILLDTQGMFDHRLSTNEGAKIFGLSILLSSVQCYNIMQNIQENDLQSLELFIDYSKFAVEQSTEKSFQKLLFIVRDWPYASETYYGWHGQDMIHEILEGDAEQTSDMRRLRERIVSSFDEIGAFLLPNPGETVANGRFSGDMQQISSKFKQFVAELATDLLAPENVIVKRINGQKVRARDLAQLIESYVNIFNRDDLPEPKTILDTMTEINHLMIFNECIENYTTSMQKVFHGVESYINDIELRKIHNGLKNQTVEQFLKKPKFGDPKQKSDLQLKVDDNIEKKFDNFQVENENMRKDFISRTEANLSTLHTLCLNKYIESMTNAFNNVDNYFREANLTELHRAEKNSAIQQFRNKPNSGDDDLISDMQRKIENDIETKFEIFKEKNIRMRENYIEHHVEKYGRLRISFENVIAKAQLNGHFCDFVLDDLNPCDPFIVIYVNGKREFRTGTRWNTTRPTFFELFCTSKIKKNSEIGIEMWDEDKLSNDELLLSRDMNVEELLSNGNDRLYTMRGRRNGNQIDIRVSWEEELINLDK